MSQIAQALGCKTLDSLVFDPFPNLKALILKVPGFVGFACLPEQEAQTIQHDVLTLRVENFAGDLVSLHEILLGFNRASGL